MKDNKMLKKLIKDNNTFVFISPHFDDAALSCGSLIAHLAKKGKKVIVVNIFTKAHRGPYTLSAKKFLQTSGNYHDATKLYKAREEEDKTALHSIKVNKIINLGLSDALFRKNKTKSFFGKILPEFSHLYPTFKLHILRGVSKNDNSIKIIQNKLNKIIPKKAVIFAPLAIGNHVDHKITRIACEGIYLNINYYSDFPYNVKTNEINISSKEYEKAEIEIDQNKKNKLIKIYATQFLGLFGNGQMPKHQEIFYIRVEKNKSDFSNLQFITFKKHLLGTLLNLITRRVKMTNYPKISGYKLIQPIRLQNRSNNNSVAIYKVSEQKVIVKHLKYEKNSLVTYQILNEASMLKILGGIKMKSKKYIVQFPKLIKASSNKNEIFISMEYIKGSILKKYSKDESTTIIMDCINMLINTNNLIDKSVFSNLPKRGEIFMVLTLPIYFLLAIKQNPKKTMLYTILMIKFYLYVILLINKEKTYVLAHKALHEENVIIKGKEIFIIDPQMSVVAEKFSDLSITTRFYLEKIGIENTNRLISNFVKSRDDMRSFKKLSIFYIIQTLAINPKRDPYHIQAQNFLQKMSGLCNL